jgi:crossover junction endodeoxyribonuclease RuvC
MLILGLDPGTAVTGYGVVREDETRTTLVECGVIRTNSRRPLPFRLREIHLGVQELLEKHAPDAVAVEDTFFGRNVRTTVALGQARGVILLAAEEAGLPVFEFPPAEVKKAVVGTGAATKEQVQYMLMTVLRLRSAPSPADAADGVAVALTGMRHAHLLRLTEEGPARKDRPLRGSRA